jgi:hypothetical protein
MKRLLRIILPTAIGAIGLVASVLPASAGTNGQHIKLYESSNIGSLCISGYNQSASLVTLCTTAPAAIFNYNNYGSHWWKVYNGVPQSISYYGTSSYGNYLGANTCWVPEYQPGNDWWQCNSV